MKIALIIYGIIMYWAICRMFSTYDRKCLSRDLFINVKNEHIWRLIAGSHRGGRRMPKEDWYKISIMGIATYIVLLPVLLFFCSLVLDIRLANMPNGYFWTVHTAIVIFINFMDELLGNMFNR